MDFAYPVLGFCRRLYVQLISIIFLTLTHTLVMHANLLPQIHGAGSDMYLLPTALTVHEPAVLPTRLNVLRDLELTSINSWLYVIHLAKFTFSSLSVLFQRYLADGSL